MKPALRIASIILGALVLLVLAALYAGPWLVGEERLRRLARQAAREYAGLELTIAQPVSLALLPRPTLVAQDIRLRSADNNLQGEQAEPLLRAERLELQLALAPLLQGGLHVTTCKLIRPVLHVARGNDGRWNSRRDGAATAAPPASFSFGPFHGAHLEISQGRVVIQDNAGASPLELRGVELSCQAVVNGDELAIDDLDLALTIVGAALPWAEPAPLRLRASFNYAPGKAYAQCRDLKLSIWDASCAAEFHVSELASDPQMKGTVSLQAPWPTLQRILGLSPPRPLDRQPDLRAGLRVSGSSEALRLQDIYLRMGETDLLGEASLSLAQPAHLNLSLQGALLDLAPFLAMDAGNTDPVEASPPSPPPAGLLLWSDALAIDAALQLAVLRFPGLEFRNVNLHAVGGNGTLHVGPIRPGPLALTADGEISGAFDAAIEAQELALALRLSLTGAAMETLLARMTAEPPLSGAAEANLELAARGADWSTLLGALRGTLRLKVENGGMLGSEFKMLNGNFILQGIPERPPLSATDSP